MNQLLIQTLLFIIMTAIIAFVCMNIAELLNEFLDAASETLMKFDIGV